MKRKSTYKSKMQGLPNWIRKNKIVFTRMWTDEEIKEGREKDEKLKKNTFIVEKKEKVILIDNEKTGCKKPVFFYVNSKMKVKGSNPFLT